MKFWERIRRALRRPHRYASGGIIKGGQVYIFGERTNGSVMPGEAFDKIVSSLLPSGSSSVKPPPPIVVRINSSAIPPFGNGDLIGKLVRGHMGEAIRKALINVDEYVEALRPQDVDRVDDDIETDPTLNDMQRLERQAERVTARRRALLRALLEGMLARNEEKK